MLRVVLSIAMLVVVFASEARADETATTTPATPAIEVQLLGEVPHAGRYTLPAGSRLSDVLAAAGAWPAAKADGPIAAMFAAMLAQADLTRVFLTRTVGEHHTSYMIDMTVRPNHVPTDPVLQAGDRVFVPQQRGLSPRTIAPSRSPFAGAQGDVTTS